MAKYFVHNGLLFQTISVPRDTFEEFSDETPIDAVTLESIAAALGPDIAPGDNTEEQLNALIGIWGMTPQDSFQSLGRNLIRREAPVIHRQVQDRNDQNIRGTLHEKSWHQILPVGFSTVLSVLPNSTDDAAAARNRIITKSLETEHLQIHKHAPRSGERNQDAADRAWESWRAHELATVSEKELARVRTGYLGERG